MRTIHVIAMVSALLPASLSAADSNGNAVETMIAAYNDGSSPIEDFCQNSSIFKVASCKYTAIQNYVADEAKLTTEAENTAMDKRGAVKEVMEVVKTTSATPIANFSALLANGNFSSLSQQTLDGVMPDGTIIHDLRDICYVNKENRAAFDKQSELLRSAADSPINTSVSDQDCATDLPELLTQIDIRLRLLADIDWSLRKVDVTTTNNLRAYSKTFSGNAFMNSGSCANVMDALHGINAGLVSEQLAVWGYGHFDSGPENQQPKGGLSGYVADTISSLKSLRSSIVGIQNKCNTQ